LRYRQLDQFDQQMIAVTKKYSVLSATPRHIWEHNDDKILIFERAGLIWAFNFHPTRSFPDYQFSVAAGKSIILLDSDAPEFGGHNRIDHAQPHLTFPASQTHPSAHRLSLYLPSRTALVLGASRG
jgi:1,4-alpha-glucan branching enzyme